VTNRRQLTHTNPRSPRNLRGLVFDFDGLICDTETSAYETARDIYAEHGVELTITQWQSRIGTHGRHWLADLESAIGPLSDREALAERRRLAHHERLRAELARPGVAEFTARAVDAGLALAVASSSSVQWVSDHLERLGLLDRFSAISTCEDGVPAKPEPVVYRRALEAIGTDARDAAAFEDSPNGIAAAKAAGLFCVAVPNRMTTGLDLSAADMVVESFLEIELDHLGFTS
jgi:HAD superfamily hydrolase (TIGR01509 family)